MEACIDQGCDGDGTTMTPMVVFEGTTVTAGVHSVSMSVRATTKVFKVKLATEPTDAVRVTVKDPTDEQWMLGRLRRR